MFSNYYKGILWESLPKGDEKNRLIAATDDELEKIYNKSKAEAMKIYRDYKNFKTTIKNGKVVVGSCYTASNSEDISLLSDSVEKTLIGLLTKSYSLAKSEINSTKGIVSNAAGSAVRALRTAGGMLSSILGGKPIPKTKFETDVQKPIKELCELSKKKKKWDCGSMNKDAKSDEKDIEEIFNKFKRTQASLEGYVKYTFGQFPIGETFENMPGVQVFLRILLGLAGIERADKGISSDGVGNGKARANYVFESPGFCKNYSLGGGLLALLVYNAMVVIEDVQMKSKYNTKVFPCPRDMEELDRKSSEVRKKLKPFENKYGE